MNLGRTVFSQLIEHLPSKEFQKCVSRYRGDSYLKSFSCWDQFLAMAFAQLTYRAIVRKRLGLEASLYQILQILSVTQFEKMPLLQALQPSDSPNESPYDPNQLILFDF